MGERKELITFIGQDVGSGLGTSTQPAVEVESDTQVGTRIGQHTAREGRKKSERELEGHLSPLPCLGGLHLP